MTDDSLAQNISQLLQTPCMLRCSTALRSGDWADDGLGGIYNGEGWTGRRTDDNLRIFKAHLIKVGAGGGTSSCPFEP